MNCLRCGRETTNQQVFCDACLQDMARHPVKPDAPIHLPVHTPREEPRKPPRRKKKVLSPEEMLPVLRRRIRRLTVAVVVLILLLAGAVTGVFLMKNLQTVPNIGQNYRSVDSSGVNP